MSMLLAALLALQAGSAPSAAVDGAAGPPGEVRILSRAGGTVQRYTAYEPSVVFLQDFRGVWYRAALTGPCFEGPPYRQGISFRQRGTDSAVDRFATLVRTFDGRSCGIRSLTLGNPPKGARSIAGGGADR